MPFPDDIESPIPVPHCQYCNEPLHGIGLFNWQAGVWMILCIHCPHCMKAFYFQPLPLAVEEPSRIQRPS